ncbi:MAG: PQQ-like beta-propeller repeat protein [Dehalococcoidales bacterium]|nr:MAG: PQQ-like beta-propeller repeat protein [Dehalococcoidales bacterium]
MDPIPEKSEPETKELEQWLVCPVCKQPNPVGTPHCRHCWGASLYSVDPVTNEELEIIMERERVRSRRRNLIKTVSVSILAPLLFSIVVFLSIYSFSDLILSPSPTLNSNPLPGEWTMFRHDLSHSGSINTGSTQPQGTLKWSFFPLEEELAIVQTAMDIMIAEKGLISVTATDRTNRMSAFPEGNPLYPDYLDIEITEGQYSCDSEGSIRPESGSQSKTVLSSSPTVVDSVIYFGTQEGSLYALDSDTGTKLWEFRTGGIVESSPAVVDGIVYFGSTDGNFYALNAETGAKLWNFRSGMANQSSPAVADGMVFFGSDNSKMYALDTKTGEILWEFKSDGPIISSPAVANGIVYFSTASKHVYALQASNGRFRLRVRLDGTISSPAVKDGIVYINIGSNLFALDGKARNWPGEYQLGNFWIQMYAFHLAPIPPPMSGYLWNVPRLGGRSHSSPALTSDTIYTAFDRYLYAIDIKTHEKLWELPFEAGGELRSSPALGDDVVYIGSEDGLLYAVDTTNGEELWHFATDGAINSSPALADGIIYVTSNDGRLYAIE